MHLCPHGVSENKMMLIFSVRAELTESATHPASPNSTEGLWDHVPVYAM